MTDSSLSTLTTSSRVCGTAELSNEGPADDTERTADVSESLHEEEAATDPNVSDSSQELTTDSSSTPFSLATASAALIATPVSSTDDSAGARIETSPPRPAPASSGSGSRPSRYEPMPPNFDAKDTVRAAASAAEAVRQETPMVYAEPVVSLYDNPMVVPVRPRASVRAVTPVEEDLETPQPIAQYGGDDDDDETDSEAKLTPPETASTFSLFSWLVHPESKSWLCRAVVAIIVLAVVAVAGVCGSGNCKAPDAPPLTVTNGTLDGEEETPHPTPTVPPGGESADPPNPTPAPRTPSTTGICFATKDELEYAIDAYLDDGSPDSLVAEIHGWPIGNWCMEPTLEDFSGLFSPNGPRRNKALLYFDEDISGWNMSGAKSLASMFYGAEFFNQDLPWNISQVTDLSLTFFGAGSFNGHLPWDTSNVRSTRLMFAGAKSFNRDVASWRLLRVQDASGMFRGASRFSQDLCTWSETLPENATVVSMFEHTNCTSTDPGSFCESCETVGVQTPIPTFAPTPEPSGSPYTSHPTIRGSRPETVAPASPTEYSSSASASGDDEDSTFCFASSAELYSAVDAYFLDNSTDSLLAMTYGTIDDWCVNKVEDFSYLFAASRNPLAVDFNQDISRWRPYDAINMTRMFYGASTFNQSLCSWRYRLDPETVVDFMFAQTSCPSKRDPKLVPGDRGPFCFECD